jgi:hypothetical protein
VTARSYVSPMGLVIYEQDAIENDDLSPADNVGVTESYDYGDVIPHTPVVYYHERDAALAYNVTPSSYMTRQQILDPNGALNPGGEPGSVNRFPYTINGIPNWEDRTTWGAAPVIPKRQVYGSYGDVGNTDSYSTFYAQAIAQSAQDQLTQEQQWAEMSGSF